MNPAPSSNPIQTPPLDSPWYLAYTKPRSESLARLNLDRQGFATYLPLFKTFRKTSEGLQPALEPMFPRYVFFQPHDASQSIATVRSTVGVLTLVRFGVEPAVLKPQALRFIQAFEAERNAADLAQISPIQPGRRVRLRVNTGLSGLEGIVTAVAKHRVTFLLDFLGREKLVTVDHDRLDLV